MRARPAACRAARSRTSGAHPPTPRPPASSGTPRCWTPSRPRGCSTWPAPTRGADAGRDARWRCGGPPCRSTRTARCPGPRPVGPGDPGGHPAGRRAGRPTGSASSTRSPRSAYPWRWGRTSRLRLDPARTVAPVPSTGVTTLTPLRTETARPLSGAVHRLSPMKRPAYGLLVGVALLMGLVAVVVSLSLGIAAARPGRLPRPRLGAPAGDGARRLPRRRDPAVAVAGAHAAAARVAAGGPADHARALDPRADRARDHRADLLLRHLRQLPEPQELPARGSTTRWTTRCCTRSTSGCSSATSRPPSCTRSSARPGPRTSSPSSTCSTCRSRRSASSCGWSGRATSPTATGTPPPTA